MAWDVEKQIMSRSRKGLRFYISNKLPGDATAGSLGPSIKEQKLRSPALASWGPRYSHKGLTCHHSTAYLSVRGFTLGDVHLMGVHEHIMTRIPHSSITQNSFTALKIPCAPPFPPASDRSEPLATNDLFAVSMVLPFPECHRVGFDFFQ